VELSWTLRSFSGDIVATCREGRLAEVQICWQPLGEGDAELDASCQDSRSATFPCEEQNGTSGFEIESGPTAFWIEPLCRDLAPPDPGTYQVPAPIVRSVDEGRIVTLNSLLIVVTPLGTSCPPAGCTCVRALPAGLQGYR
jgi:hypothetical protein